MAETIYLPAMRDDGETEIMVEFTVHSWGSPPQTYGLPEDCDAGDPIEVEITDCWIEGSKPLADGQGPLRVSLTDAEVERLETAFCENPPEPDYGDYDE